MPGISQSTSSSLPSTSPLSAHSSTIPTSLHSPSSQFVGTPFTTPSSTSTPFEYPFPKDSAAISTASSAGTSPSLGGHGVRPPYGTAPAPPSSFTSNSDPRRRGTLPIPIPSSGASHARELDQALQMGLGIGLRSSSVPVPPSLIEKARRRSSNLNYA